MTQRPSAFPGADHGLNPSPAARSRNPLLGRFPGAAPSGWAALPSPTSASELWTTDPAWRSCGLGASAPSSLSLGSLLIAFLYALTRPGARTTSALALACRGPARPRTSRDTLPLGSSRACYRNPFRNALRLRLRGAAPAVVLAAEPRHFSPARFRNPLLARLRSPSAERLWWGGGYRPPSWLLSHMLLQSIPLCPEAVPPKRSLSRCTSRRGTATSARSLPHSHPILVTPAAMQRA